MFNGLCLPLVIGVIDSIVSAGGTTKKPGRKSVKQGIVLPGAKITAFSTSIFQRMRAMDDINFDQI